MTCHACEESREIDEEAPPCEIGMPCLIPPLDEAGAKAMEIREQVVKLQNLIDPGTVLKLHGCGLAELELLAVIEEELSKTKMEKKDNV